MSTALGIAATTAVLKDHLANGFAANNLASVVGNVTVSAVAPDKIIAAGAAEPTQLNLYLHQVTFNQGWRNARLPSRDGGGARIDAPLLALNLHYLVTAYGAPVYYPEILLGHAMQLFHETPVLTRDAIRKALSPTTPDPTLPPQLANAELAEQVEQLKISPEVFNTEEISRLWSAMQAHYRPTAAYQVTVVLIESRKSTRRALPVLQRQAHVVTLDYPVIDEIQGVAGADTPIFADSTLLIKGKNLRGSITRVVIGGIEITPLAQDVKADEIRVSLATFPATLYAGPHAVQVMHHLDMGVPPTAHRVFASNTATFILQPGITAQVPSRTASVVNGVTVKKGTIVVDFVPHVEKHQNVVLHLNELVAAPATRAPNAFSFKAPANNGITANNVSDTASVQFAFDKVVAGTYLIRVLVDGAESTLQTNAQGQFDKPKRAF